MTSFVASPYTCGWREGLSSELLSLRDAKSARELLICPGCRVQTLSGNREVGDVGRLLDTTGEIDLAETEARADAVGDPLRRTLYDGS